MNTKHGRCEGVIRRLWTAAAAALAIGVAACGGGSSTPPPSSQPAAATMRVHYQRGDGAYANWAVYAWNGPTTPSSGWPGSPRFVFDQTDGFGRYVDIAIDTSKTELDFLLNQGTNGSDTVKDGDCDRTIAFNADIATHGQEIWLKSGDCAVYPSLAAANAISVASARAMWLDPATIAWPSADAGAQYRLYHAAAGGIAVDPTGGVSGADGYYELASASGISATLAATFPQLATATAFTLPADAQASVKSLLKGQLVIVKLVGGAPTAGTQLQTQGVIDAVYAAQATTQSLGVSFAGDGTPTFRLWAPTATSVRLNIVGGASVAMSEDTVSGTWSVVGDKAWAGSAYYTYDVQVFARTDGATVRTYTTTDPYAVSLDANGQAALVADLSSAALKPANWDAHAIPPLAAPEDSILYELHLRDFSANDASVPAALRGKYAAFTQTASNGMQHLASLASAGLTHVHLLPLFDIASIDEVNCTTPAIVSSGATSSTPQSIATAAAAGDCFNWGYDPRHYGAPEGSYSSDPADGRTRVAEFRQMVAALHGIGLRVVMDVVYNHTSGNFLDRIVPGYYYRLDGDGNIANSSCCQNTAPEFAMMEKLMIDTLQAWAVQYKVDGFRFDIMGHIPKSAMLHAQAAVDAAAGRALVYYGEAWNFGEVANDARFVQARQANMAGTGIGSFNDRIRDAIRGGGPFDSGDDLVKNQGFASGLCYDANAALSGACGDAQRSDLQYRQNLIRIGMAGNLADFVLDGKKASAFDYGGQPAGFTQDPQEIVNYAGVHDGETLYDISQYKHPAGTTSSERARAQVVALGTVLMSQGIPFLHAGDELLRSKAFDRDSYDSGDWFNRIDWTAGTNYIAEFGLPPAGKNEGNWPVMSPVLSNAAVVPSAADIAAARDAVMDLMRVRRDTTMLRLRSGADVMRCVSFPDQGAAQQDGLVVMKVGLGDASCGDGKYKNLVVLVNANKAAQSFTIASLAGQALALHPLQAGGSDPRVKTAGFDAASGAFTVPGRTVAVFVQP